MGTTATIATVSSASYIGILLGPPLIGGLTGVTGNLRWSLLVDAGIMFTVTLIAFLIQNTLDDIWCYTISYMILHKMIIYEILHDATLFYFLVLGFKCGCVICTYIQICIYIYTYIHICIPDTQDDKWDLIWCDIEESQLREELVRDNTNVRDRVFTGAGLNITEHNNKAPVMQELQNPKNKKIKTLLGQLGLIVL